MRLAFTAAAVVILTAAAFSFGIAQDKRAAFRRPAVLPAPPGGAFNERAARLGERLFHDVRLSADNTRSCATCHDSDKGWSDGLKRAQGNDGTPLKRRTPTLLDVGSGASFFWDGRAATLEEQALMPIQDAHEMAQSMPVLVDKLTAMPDYRRAFAAAFPESPAISQANLARAVAMFERTIRSGDTPFDRWAAGDEAAISEAAKRGFALFTGAAGCAGCHAGWQFTDHGFHDIGLPGNREGAEDRGRGEAAGDKSLDFAFKTPTLRGVAQRGPYMHDGRFADLRAVLDHYRSGVQRRPTLSASMPTLDIAAADANELIAFLGALTPDGPPPRLAFANDAPVKRVETSRVAELALSFAPAAIRLRLGQSLAVVNDDERVHALRVSHPKLDFASGTQRPGETVRLDFPEAGTYDVICTIHPKMRLNVEITP